MGEGIQRGAQEPQGEGGGVQGRFEVPLGLVAERTLRSLIRSIADRLKKEKFTVAQTLALLREQERLSKQLKETAAARLEAQLEKKQAK